MPGFLERLADRHAAIDELGLLVVAHQDDEVIGVGSRLSRFRDIHVVHVTDGAPLDLDGSTELGFASREAYAGERAREVERALALVDVPPSRVRRLGLVDQRTSFSMGALATLLLATMREIGPEVVITHPFENGHPDHDATAFAVHLAGRLLADAGERAPQLVEFASYHDADGSGAMAAQSFLPADTPAVTIALDEAEQALKRRLYACHATQETVLRDFPVDRESYRLAPTYDFLAPPHPWRPLYERWFATMTRERWQRLAAETLAAFGPTG